MAERLRVPATRSVLLRLRKDRRTLVSAADLLERKRRVLAHQTFELLPQWRTQHREAFASLTAAYASFGRTRMRSTTDELRQIVAGMPSMLSVALRRQPLAGVPTYQVTTETAPLRPRFGLLGSTAELDRTIVSMRDAAGALAHLAEAQATLRSLTRALEKTGRQVRILRERLIPLHETTIRQIEDDLDEQERSYLFQLKRIR
ncbi:MAG: V-type ATP synthase subunit D [Vicinamibacterales bacterium]|nr:V-type ATP synthase subunit D [Vicinamibacterales bacterium]